MMTIRKIENSVVLTLSKEFIESIGASESDIVFVDEEKLKAANAKKEVLDEDHEDLEMMIAKSVQKHDGLYQELTDI
ncbi:addiction module antitoxin [Enterococcus sp.]|uniref:addiction module antitoxin n=1 Tax=Enterococcus sp. TaxID=35783 RepID=UPI002912DD37|nr:addiction module antitoxin [Enterococcus sp.]MDU5334904.1 addiction module antitoxin [Enterococcus sp.]